MNSISCPYCGNYIPLNHFYCSKLVVDRNLKIIERSGTIPASGAIIQTAKGSPFVSLHTIRCDACNSKILRISTASDNIDDSIPIIPTSDAKPLPIYVPEQIREDYKEAYDILYISPKSSAALSRRCLQSMIHDFWNIREKNLNAELTALKPKIEPVLWEALNGLRCIGNIAAHPEFNVSTIINIEPEEAKQLLLLVELLVDDWYVTRYNKQEILRRVANINAEKQSLREL